MFGLKDGTSRELKWRQNQLERNPALWSSCRLNQRNQSHKCGWREPSFSIWNQREHFCSCSYKQRRCRRFDDPTLRLGPDSSDIGTERRSCTKSLPWVPNNIQFCCSWIEQSVKSVNPWMVLCWIGKNDLCGSTKLQTITSCRTRNAVQRFFGPFHRS